MGRPRECCRITLRGQIERLSDSELEIFVFSEDFYPVISGDLLLSITRRLNVIVNLEDKVLLKLFDGDANVVREGVIVNVMWFPTLDRLVVDFR
ncbi:MAG TPA: hypothetical protein VJ044_02660 [Candidatus Hodarchaeales archaeon]|nr:hypothetical protein [Candidatus Hodarchaeales archaeon]